MGRDRLPPPARARGEGAAPRARLLVAWHDAGGAAIETEGEVDAVGPEWQTLRMLLTVPENAAAALVVVSPDRGSVVWCDDVFFGEVSYTPEE